MKIKDTIKPRTCPKCGAVYKAPSAISRTDNSTSICPDCGTREALEALGLSVSEREEIIRIVHEHTA